MGCNDCKNNEEQSFAMQMLKEYKKNGQRWFGIAIAELIVILLIFTGIFAFFWTSDIESYTQDSAGYNNINTGTQGDVINGSEPNNN